MYNYGDALKQQREQNGFTQNALAKATGLKQQMISWWEAGKGLPNIDFCVQLADFYGITLDELIGRNTKNDETVYEFSYTRTNKKLIHEEEK